MTKRYTLKPSKLSFIYSPCSNKIYKEIDFYKLKISTSTATCRLISVKKSKSPFNRAFLFIPGKFKNFNLFQIFYFRLDERQEAFVVELVKKYGKEEQYLDKNGEWINIRQSLLDISNQQSKFENFVNLYQI